MVEGIFKKGLVLGIIILLISVGSQPAFANDLSKSSFGGDSPPEVELTFIVVMGWGYLFTANCSDDTGIDRVEFTLDDGVVSVVCREPYQWSAPTEKVKNKIVCAVAYDFEGNNASDCVEIKSKSAENNEIEPVDEYTEIFTFIYGVFGDCKKDGKGLFIHHNVEIWSRCDYYHVLGIIGIRQPFKRFDAEVAYIKVPLLIGILLVDFGIVWGYAFGNVEWVEFYY